MLTAFNGVPISTLAVRERPHTHTIHSRYQISQDKWQADKLTKQHRRRDKEIQVSESKQRRFLTSSGLEKLCCCCSRVFSARQSSRTRLTNLDDDEFNPSIDWCSSSCPCMSWSSLCNDHHPRFQFLTEWTAEGWTISERNSRGKISEKDSENGSRSPAESPGIRNQISVVFGIMPNCQILAASLDKTTLFRNWHQWLVRMNLPVHHTEEERSKVAVVAVTGLHFALRYIYVRPSLIPNYFFKLPTFSSHQNFPTHTNFQLFHHIVPISTKLPILAWTKHTLKISYHISKYILIHLYRRHKYHTWSINRRFQLRPNLILGLLHVRSD